MQKGIVIGVVVGLVLAFAIFSVGLYSGNAITGDAIFNLFSKSNTQAQQNTQPTLTIKPNIKPDLGLNKKPGQIVNLPACFFVGEQGGDMGFGSNFLFINSPQIRTVDVCNYFNKVNGYHTFENKNYVPVAYTERNIYKNYIGNKNCEGTPLEIVKSLLWNLNTKDKINILLFREVTPEASKDKCMPVGSNSYKYQYFNTGVWCCAQD